MKTRTGNLADLSGDVIIVHGVNGAWLHEPKFGAGFAADIAAQDPGARLSYLQAWGPGPGQPFIYSDRYPHLRGCAQAHTGKQGLPLGWVFPYRMTNGAWLLHGVTQPYVRGTQRLVGKDMCADQRPARLSAVHAVLDNAVRFMRRLAFEEGRPRDLHCTRLGCGLGGLEWTDVQSCIERVEASQNREIPHPHLVHPDVALARRFKVEFTVWGRRAEELAA